MEATELAAAESWVREHVRPAGALEVVHERAWSTVVRVPTGGGAAWFKACRALQAFEPRLTAALQRRWPDRLAEVLGHDEERARLLLADAGTPVGAFGNSPDAWAAALPLYAELQRGEAAHADEHLAGGVTDRRLERLPALYEDLAGRELPLEPEERELLRRFAPGFGRLCAELDGQGVPETVQHDDLHFGNVYEKDGRMLILDWGDTSVAHPFFSLFVTFRFLEEVNHLEPGDRTYPRLRDAYLEPWGRDLEHTFALAHRVGAFAHAHGWLRLRDHLPEGERKLIEPGFAAILRRALARVAV